MLLLDESDPPAPTGEIDYDATPSHLGGSDTNNGVVTNWGPGWENLGQSLGDFSFDDAIADPDSGYSAVESTDGLPPAFSTAAYMYEDSHAHDAAGDDYAAGGDSQITYYNADGVILGFAMTNQSELSSNTQFTLSDNVTNVGSSWSYEYETGYRFVTNGVDSDDGAITGISSADNGGLPVNYRLEEESRTEVGSDSPNFVRDLIFNEDTGLLISGTGKDGSTETVWGADWEIVSETVSLTGLEAYDTSSLDSAFFDGYVASSITDENPDIFAIVDDFDQNTVHLVNGAGAEIGHISSYGAEDEGDVHIEYFDANYNKVGEEMSNYYGSSEYFKVQLTDDADGTITGEDGGSYIKETGSSENRMDGEVDYSEEYVSYYAVTDEGYEGSYLSGTRTVTDYIDG